MRNHIAGGPRIVVGVDGSPASVASLGWATREADLRQAELHLVCAWEDAERSRAPYAVCGDVPTRDETRADAARLLATSLRAVFGQVLPPRLRAELVEGRPEQVLLDRAAGAELLVLGSSCRVGRLPQPAGPVHRACLRGAPCPVVIVGMCHETGSRSAGPLPASLRKAS